MPDPRVSKLAQVLIHYSLELEAGQQCFIRTEPLAEELTLEVYTEAIKAGAHVFVQNVVPGAEEIFFKHASDEQLEYISPVRKLLLETFDAMLSIGAEHNTRALTAVDPERMARIHRVNAPLTKSFFERAARKEAN